MNPCRFIRPDDYVNSPNFELSEKGVLVMYFEVENNVKCLVREGGGKHLILPPTLVMVESGSIDDIITTFLKGIDGLMGDYIPTNLQEQFIKDVKTIIKQ